MTAQKKGGKNVEKQGYREQLEVLLKMFPNRTALNVQEVAKVMNCNERTVKAAIERRKDPLPARNIAQSSAQRKRYLIPITALARWQIGN